MPAGSLVTQAPAARPSFRRRLAALGVDYAVFVGWAGVLGLGALVVVTVRGGLPNWLEDGVGFAELYGILLIVLPVGVYLYLCEASARQATLGKRALRLRVVGAASGARPGRWRVLVRTVVKLVPWETGHFFVWHLFDVARTAGTDAPLPAWIAAGLVAAGALFVGYVLVVAFQRDRRGPHDLVAGTRVVQDARVAAA